MMTGFTNFFGDQIEFSIEIDQQKKKRHFHLFKLLLTCIVVSRFLNGGRVTGNYNIVLVGLVTQFCHQTINLSAM